MSDLPWRPKREKDPTGGIKEGWKEGEIHGAFEIVSSLKEAKAEIASAKLSIAAWTCGILAVIALAAWILLEMNVIKPLRDSSHSIKDIAGGNLTRAIVSTGKDEFGVMAADLQAMAVDLSGMITEIIRASDEAAQLCRYA